MNRLLITATSIVLLSIISFYLDVNWILWFVITILSLNLQYNPIKKDKNRLYDKSIKIALSLTYALLISIGFTSALRVNFNPDIQTIGIGLLIPLFTSNIILYKNSKEKLAFILFIFSAVLALLVFVLDIGNIIKFS